MNFIFFGGKFIGNYVLKGLLDNKLIPKGIVVYQGIIDEDLIVNAESKGAKILKLKTFRNNQEKLTIFIKTIKPDYFVSVAFPFILSPKILSLVKHPINIHTGAIPRYRGHHPMSAALLNDEKYQATTVHLMAEEVDAGEILLQDFILVKNTDTIVDIRIGLTELSLKLILKVINQLKNDSLYPKKQVGDVIWAPKRTPEDSLIDFSKDSRYIHNFIRALVDPYPNAFSFNKGKKVHIKQSIVANQAGIVLAKTIDGKYIISTGNGVVMIETDTSLAIGDKLTVND